MGDFLIAAENGAEVYRFDPRGRHLATVDALTGVELRRFEYDADDRLSSIVEESRRTTTIERDAAGVPTAIVSPYGVRTLLAVNAEGFLERITDAAGQSVAFELAPGGLLTALVDERGGRHEFSYDEDGRLLTDRDPSGAERALASSSDGQITSVTQTTPLGLVTRHDRVPTDDGIEQRVTTPAGAVSSILRDPEGHLTSTSADGTVVTTTYSADPRFGAMAPVTAETHIRLPSGLESVITQTRSVELANVSDPLSLQRLTTETRANSLVSTTDYDAATRTFVVTSPEGRQTTALLDENARLLQTSVPGLLPIDYEYDADGRLIAITSGAGADRCTVGHGHAV